MRRKNLVVVRAGANSLHRTWLNPSTERSFDIYLCPYQELGVRSNHEATVGDVIAGPKWTGLRQLLSEWKGWAEYDYIWLPDDDIFATQETIDRFFEAARALSLDLCAPALQEASFYAHYSTMRNLNCHARHTGFVEIMVPCFSAQALTRLLPTFSLTSTGWGWGLDSLWPKLLDYRNVGIVDGTPVLHTRPVGGFRDAALAQQVRAESDRIMEDFDCGQVHTTYDLIDSELHAIDLSPHQLTATLMDGWRYLLRTNPSLLPWMVKAQEPCAGWGAYPIAGTPASSCQ